MPAHYSRSRRFIAWAAGVTLPRHDPLDWRALNARIDETLWALDDSEANRGLVSLVQSAQHLATYYRSSVVSDKLYEALVASLDAMDCYRQERNDDGFGSGLGVS